MKHTGKRYWYFRNKRTYNVLEDCDGYTRYWPLDQYTESEMIEEGYEFDIDLDDPNCEWELDVYRDL